MKTKQHNIFFFAGGGSGGHYYPALAMARRLSDLCPGCEIHFVGSAHGIEARLAPEQGFPLHLISVQGFARNRFFANILTPVRLFWSLCQCGWLVLKYAPDVVIGSGGYVSGPMLFMAHLLRRPTLIQEQNSCPGVTTRILARYVDQIHLSFKGSEKYFKRRERVFITGNPVRDLNVPATVQQARQHFGLDAERPTLLVFGGSQGSRLINQAIAKALPQIMERTEAQVLWAGGKWDLQLAQEAAAAFPQRVQMREYIAEMPMAYRAADVAVCRAGALTLAELAQCGLPAVLIPFAAAAANHQEANARTLQQQQAAVMILEKELQEEVLLNEIVALLQDSEKRKMMSAAIRKTAFIKAADNLALAIMALRSKRGGN